MMTATIFLAALVATMGGELHRTNSIPTGLSGITHVSNDTYYAVNDARALMVPLNIGIDLATGQPTNCAMGAAVALEATGRRADLEGIAWDARAGVVWASDEFDGSIRAFDPASGKRRAEVALPAVQDAFRFNLSLESLAISQDGTEMWTCNEDALDIKGAHSTRDGIRAKKPRPETQGADGPASSNKKGARIRLMRFTRDSATSPWRLKGEWVYETDPIGGMRFFDQSRSGVADLAVLGDGTILALEREMSVKSGSFMPSFRCRIYSVDVSSADDVSGNSALKDFTGRAAKKSLVWGRETGFTNYEGICEGPRLADGSRTLVLISDADAGAAARVMTLILRH